MKDGQGVFEQLMLVPTVTDLNIGKALRHIGRLIDISNGLEQDAGRERALNLAAELEPRLSSAQRATLHYFQANIWAGRHSKRKASRSESWAWELPELSNEILCLRRALREPGFSFLPATRKCEIMTNLANAFSAVGRFVEAHAYWNATLDLRPDFGMALGNRGMGLHIYAKQLYERGDAILFLEAALKDVTTALSPKAARLMVGYEWAKSEFQKHKEEIERRLKSAGTVSVRTRTLGLSRTERRYRGWCLRERLFLNPLNDIGTENVAARDILLLPDHRTDLDAAPSLISAFNRLKEEFITARYLYWEGVAANHAHFADRHVWLPNTLDYQPNCLAAEKVRLAFRSAYSLFDKIAFFLNEYLALGLKPKQVNFRSLWYEPKGGRGKVLRAEFKEYRNLPLRGLRWLLRDLAADDPDFKDAIAPEAEDLRLIRDHLEHKFLTLHIIGPTQAIRDDTAYALPSNDFVSKALHLLKLARAALIYLSLGVHAEECLRQEEKKGHEIALPITLPLISDRLKQLL